MKTIVIISNKFIKLNMKISKFLFDCIALTKIIEIFHIIDNLTIGILIKMNIIDFERIQINVIKLIIKSYHNMFVDFLSTISND